MQKKERIFLTQTIVKQSLVIYKSKSIELWVGQDNLTSISDIAREQ